MQMNVKTISKWREPLSSPFQVSHNQLNRFLFASESLKRPFSAVAMAAVHAAGCIMYTEMLAACTMPFYACAIFWDNLALSARSQFEHLSNAVEARVNASDEGRLPFDELSQM
jgi:hypothetical protein